MSTPVREKNPLSSSDAVKADPVEPSSTSILSQPKQKLTAQFKRAITMMKQRSEPEHNSSPTLQSSSSFTEKPLQSFDSAHLSSLIEEPIGPVDSSSSMKSSSFVSIKPSMERSSSIQDTDSSTTTAATIVNLDPSIRINYPSTSSPTFPPNLVKKSLQQIHSSILQTMNQESPAPSSSSLHPTSASSSSTSTGDITILETLL